MWDVVAKGGWLMAPILAGSVVGLAVFLERLVALARSRVVPPGLGPSVREALEAGDLEAARSRAAASDSALGRLLQAGLLLAEESRERQRERLEEVGRREMARLERYVGVLGVVASIEPLLGLLGTVVGMIGVFQKVVHAGVGDPALLAEGIWEALITTAAGLTVAIPAFIAWRVLESRVDDHLRLLEEEASALVDASEGVRREV